MRRSKLSDFELEEKEYLDRKLAREKKALEEDLDAAEVIIIHNYANPNVSRTACVINMVRCIPIKGG